MKKRGFTLIEILAVIIVLSVMALITVPIILNVVKTVKKKAFEDSLYSIFKATELYMAKNEIATLETGLNINDSKLLIKNNNFKSGTVYSADNNIKIDLITDNEFCASGTIDKLDIVEGSCTKLDKTEPSIEIVNIVATTNSIRIIVNANDTESGIQGHFYSIDEGKTWTDKTDNNYYTFKNLKNNKEYKIMVKAINGNDLEQVTDVRLVTTVDIPEITYLIDKEGWQKEKTLTITYPTITDQELIYEYSKDLGLTWNKANNVEKIVFNSNGTIIARVSDSVNIINSSVITISQIDNVIPSITSVSGNASTWTKTNITLTINGSNDAESGLDNSPYSFDNGVTWQTSNTKVYSNNVNGIVIKVKDTVGNIYTHEVINVTKIDKVAPTCGTVSGAGSSWTGSNRTISVSCNDNAECSQTSFSNTFTTTLSTSYITITDKAGNSTNCPVNVYVDKTKPTMLSVSLHKSNGTTYTSGTVSTMPVTAYQSASDNVGISKYIYSHNVGGPYSDMPTNWTITWDGNWPFYVKAVDTVGNISDNYISYQLIINQTVSIINLVANGGFETGNLDSWSQLSNQGGNVFATTDRAEGTYAAFFSPQDNTYWAQRYQNIWSNSGHVYYARVYAKTGLGSAGMKINGFTGSTIGLENAGSGWARISSYFRADRSQWGNVTIGAFIQHIGQANYVDAVMLIDLTGAYGSGYEPSQAWCDAYIPFFTGTITASRP